MRLTLTVVDPYGGGSADVVLDADPESTVGDIAEELAKQVGIAGAQVIPIGHQGQAGTGGAPLVYVDGYAVDPSATVVGSPLREGAVVSLQDPSGCLPGEPTGLVELRVVGGPGAGFVHRLGVGKYDIGSGPAAYVRIEDPEVDARALTLSVATDGTCKVAVHSDKEGVTLDGESVQERDGDDWPLGAQIAVGNSLVELARYAPPNAALKWSEDGVGLDYNRPPRLRPAERQTNFRLPSSPRDYEARPLPWLMALTPLVGAVVAVMVFGRWYYLIMAGLSPILLFANYFNDKKHGRKSHAKQVKEYEEQKARIEKDAQAALVAERDDRRQAIPDPAVVLSVATGPRTRLWERRRTDRDHLLLRVGTGQLPSEVVLDDPEQDDHRRQVTWKIEDAPVALSLRTLGVVGIAGPGDSARSLGRWAVAQTAALHSPMDVQFYVLSENSAQSEWDWVRWLPHSRPSGGQDVNVLIGTDAETVGARIGELTQILDARKKAAEQKGGGAQGSSFTDPDIVVVWDGSRRLRSLPGVVRLLREGPAVSMFAVCIDAEERFLPGECQAFVVAEPRAEESGRQQRDAEARPAQQVAGGFPSFQAWHTNAPAEPEQRARAEKLRLRVEEAGVERITGVRPDFVTPAWCLRLARSLSALRDISGETEDSALPGSSRLLDVLQLEPPTADAIGARWRMGGQSTMAVIGESYDGPFGIDMRKDGPHGLIAGTTGSGKSELLQTIVAALAVANTPENMTFVLVDYKGGSAFKDCVKLPHTVGMVTDLDAHLVERALESLGAELKRREHILAAADAKDIEDYQDLVRRDPSHAPVPRLLIVIDEFASMVRDLPDFVTGLVNIAQRGRSLGIHLLLATQRPSGVVSPEIRANTNLRIALRVTDGGESSDVIDSPEAGHISKNTPGRAYVRLGHSSLVPFQSGRVGGRRPGAADPAALAPWVGPLGWEELGRAALTKPKTESREDDEITDLKVLVDAVRDANRSMGIPAQHSPWLPALDEKLLLDEIDVPALAGAAPGKLPPAPYGIEDLPSDQARRPVVVDFASFGHLMIGGAPRSGRSQVLRTIAGSLARTHSTADVHLYGIDCGNGALNALTRLPHCGAVVGRNQTERVVRLVNRLKGELSRRQDLLADSGFADIGEQRASAEESERLPHIVVLLDRWEGWVPTLGEVDHGSLTDELQTMMREGASVGIHLILTGDRTLLVGRIATLTEDKYGLRLADRSDFASLGIPSRKVPEEIPPGRAFRNEAGTETQFALLSEDTTGQGQAAAITAIGEAAAARDAGVPRARRPFRVDSLPSRISFPEAWEMHDPEASRSRLWALIGIGGDEIVGFGPDLADGVPSFVIAGPAKSGRSTVLMNVAQSLLAQGTRLVVAAPRQSPVRQLDGAEGVLKVFTGDDIDEDEFEELIDGASPEEPIAVLVDDGEILEDCDAESQMKKIVSRGAERGLALVIAGDEEDVCSGFSGWQVDAKKARRGILLSPQESSSGDLIGLRVSRQMVGGQVTPGKGMLHLGDGELRTVVVPG
ncbi:FtsK/SpoIIIE domain-containing protein [Streptomyces coelicolor]|uniref:Cell division-related protein n=1 Tax=Streptomyces coelicolor (strain ATCC BAA-471 / A3(2) / M145) TaxID=100226 RepID=Q9L0T6_STRCO|nr:FtsK/SpoIIIE domain-containing protein [Streptomyces coelicolor]MYU44028.1 cell division protein FtsK [Streptomyces sp. SID7813]NSL81664.1 cell division protein FtsK [Streptomyces coelicolor]QFI44451.1 cell division protein FtsK [Streptomyces coelicolor A3(2)]QKN68079.1 cell division protein FtsK [Streptomyces coelicolor]TYP05999.1 S-DNA-T family DNA segregation ATPase FtsK/SpoIIIE [Streptomyces coelicolor]